MSGRYTFVMPVSIAMGVSDVAIVLLVVKTNSIALGLVNGVCAGLGAMTAMYLNRRISCKKC